MKSGWVILLGSGETSAGGGQVYEALARRWPAEPVVSVLETPAGFELNSAQVAGRVLEFMRVRLQNYHPNLMLVPARKRGTPESPDEMQVIAPLLDSDMIFMGPGSPSYAVRQLQGSHAWEIMRARHLLGADLVFASAATIAVGCQALPVYEIYKVGEELHWKPGLDLFGAYGLKLAFFPHWNNNDGGTELDTRFCFMGAERFAALRSLLPADVTLVGLDEHTALLVDLEGGQCQVMGKDGVHILRGTESLDYLRGDSFPIEQLGSFQMPAEAGYGISAAVWQQAKDHQQQMLEKQHRPVEVPGDVMTLVAARQQARAARDWAQADVLRKQIAGLGWNVMDTPDGPVVAPAG